MYAKIEITGVLEVCTGMHIGGSSQFAAIGAVDSPVIRDTFSDMPMIPGSSLKGKLRSLVAKQYNQQGVRVAVPDDDDVRITRLFGSAKMKNRSRLLFTDMMLDNMDELKRAGLQSATEVKFENSINRLTAVANPRQIERVVRGSKYHLQLVYDVEEEADVEEDMQMLADGIRLLQFDYLGGSGSRGYGKVKISDLEAEVVIGDVSDELMDCCNKILGEIV